MQAARQARADRYGQLLQGLPLKLPVNLPDRVSAWHLYAVELDEERASATRAEVFVALRAAQIGVNVHYIPIHTQPHYQRLGFSPGDFPAAERYYAGAISLPLFPTIALAQQERVVQVLASALD